MGRLLSELVNVLVPPRSQGVDGPGKTVQRLMERGGADRERHHIKGETHRRIRALLIGALALVAGKAVDRVLLNDAVERGVVIMAKGAADSLLGPAIDNVFGLDTDEEQAKLRGDGVPRVEEPRPTQDE